MRPPFWIQCERSAQNRSNKAAGHINSRLFNILEHPSVFFGVLFDMSASPYGKLPVVGIWALWGSCFYFFLGYQMIGERGKRNGVRSHPEVIVSGHGMLGLALERDGGEGGGDTLTATEGRGKSVLDQRTCQSGTLINIYIHIYLYFFVEITLGHVLIIGHFISSS